MTDLNETNSSHVPTAAAGKEQSSYVEKEAATLAQQGSAVRTGSTKPGSHTASVKAIGFPTVRAVRKRYSETERAEKLGEIEKQAAQGESIKTAVKKAGISEQTYYHWKKISDVMVPQSGELKNLRRLEEENARLTKLLGDRLRKENAELKKKLGLD